VVIALFLQSALLLAQDWEYQVNEAIDNGQLEEARRLAQSALNEKTATAAAHEWLGRIDVQEHKDEEAIAHFQAASQSGRQSYDLEKDWATALLNLKRFAEACELLERSLSRDPSRVEFRYRLAGAYLAQGKSREALPHLEEAYRQGLRHAGMVLQLARARLDMGEEEKAVELLESVSRDQSAPNLLFEAGKLLFEHLLYQQALMPLRKAWQQKPGSYDIGMFLALSYYLSQQYGECQEVLQRVQPGNNPPLDYRILLGSTYARLGQWEEARRELEQARQQTPDRADGYLNLGMFYLERGRTREAMEMLEAGFKRMAKGSKLLYAIKGRENCDDLAPPQDMKTQDTLRGETYARLARTLQQRKQNGSALELFLLSLELDGRGANAYGGIGKICWEMDSFKVAQSFLLRGLDFHPDFSELHFNLGLIYQSLGQTQEAIQAYRKAIDLEEPKASALYWVQLGTAQMSGGREAEDAAKASFLEGLRRDPNFAQAYYELGKFYLKRKELERAEQSFEKAILFDPKLVGAYYQYGLACTRNGKPEKGRQLLEIFNRRRALRASSADGMATNSPVSP
jgi:tetratricopeptide (TPR) repeat protein